MSTIKLTRIGMIMEPEAGNELEVEGVLNPAATRGPDGALYLFPRMVAKNNYSRIGISRINFNEAGDPVSVTRIGVTGHPSFAMLHRPLFPGTTPEETRRRPLDREIRLHHECIWISYSHVSTASHRYRHLPKFVSNHPFAIPEAYWEKLKIGTGTPPMLTKHGWLIVYHGVSETGAAQNAGGQLSYSAGIMLLDKEDPTKILYRSPEPVLSPMLAEERVGVIANVVFPTGIDRRDDLSML